MGVTGHVRCRAKSPANSVLTGTEALATRMPNVCLKQARRWLGRYVAIMRHIGGRETHNFAIRVDPKVQSKVTTA